MAVIEPLSAAEVEWLTGNLTALRDAGVTDVQGLTELYDSELSRARDLPEGERDDPNALLSILGCGLGQFVSAETGLEWAIATDDQGSDLALYRRQNEFLIYPIGAVAKRWAEGESGGWIRGYVAMIRARLRQLAR